MDKILEILANDGRTTAEEIALMLNENVAEIKERIRELEEKKILLNYKALIDWEKTDKEVVEALIELKVTPQRHEGFDKIAEEIYSYPQVKALSLMSGGFDLAVTVEGKSMKDVALFVAEKLSTMESVISTATHFVLKRYKHDGVVFDKPLTDERSMMSF